ncbi:MAG: phage tail protein [Lachnospiraceae bacterium]|nr:phage tail protein [Lachnospiraceae bacterium]
MYQINLGSKILYYPANADSTIYDTEHIEDVGQAGEFRFKVPPTNPLYGELTKGALVTILRDNKEFWRGEIKEVNTDFAKVANIYCLEDISWLGDEFMTPALITDESYSQRFQAAINAYNLNRPADRQFLPGYITNVGASDICNWQTEYEWSILDDLRNCICKDNGYIKVRRVTSGNTVTRYIDIVRLEDYGSTASQPIEYGYNLLDYVKEADYGNLTNVLTPYGDELEAEIYEGYNQRLQGTTIEDLDSIAVYGRKAKAVVFDNVDNLNQLNGLAQSYLTRYSQPQLTMEVKAVDLAPVDNVVEFKIGDSVRIIAKPFAVDQRLYLTHIVRDIQNIDKNTITLSGHVTSGRTLTSQVIDATNAIDDVPSKSAILEAAKKNALAMLLDETQGGHVVYEYHETEGKADYIEAINIVDQPTIDASLKRWRWGQNGLGYMERASTTDPWPTGSNIKAAMTADGSIVADRIDTGILTASIIKAGILSDLAGKFSLNMTTGDLIMNSGTFKGALSGATGSFAGSLSAASGTFKGQLVAATGTITDGEGTLSLESGSLHMRGSSPGIFANKSGSEDYSCWGSTNSAARASGTYIEVPTIKILQATQYAIDHGWI